MLQHAATCCNMLQHAATTYTHTRASQVDVGGACAATRCRLQHAATCCNMLQLHTQTCKSCVCKRRSRSCKVRTAICCNVLQHAQKHCRTLHDATCLNYIYTLANHVYAESTSTAAGCVFTTLCNTLQRTASRAAAHCNYMHTLASHVDAQGACTAAECAFTTRCNTLQHTATHCVFTCIVSLLNSSRWLAITC